MKERGIILVIDDWFEEKVGSFNDVLVTEGYKVVRAETLTEANELYASYKDKNSKKIKLDGIIVDFKFPVGKRYNNQGNEIFDYSHNINGRPCGVEFIYTHINELNNNKIPLIINTTGDNKYKVEKLKEIGIEIGENEFGCVQNRFLQFIPIYNINDASNPLVNASGRMINEILNMFRERTSRRLIEERIQQESNWVQQRGAFFRDNKGNIIGYR